MRNESLRTIIARIRREALKRRRISEPPPPRCEKCGNSIAFVPLVDAVKGEEDCAHCREERIAYHQRYGGVATVRITEAPSREEVEGWRRGEGKG